MEKQEKSIKGLNIKKLAIKIGYSYLEGERGYWSNSAGEIISFDSMDNDYLKNCINFIDRGINELEDFEIDDDIKRHTSRMLHISKEKITEEEIKLIKKNIIIILKDKKSELMKCKENRKKYKKYK